MRILLINSVCGIRSTGRICTDIADRLAAEGNEVKIAYGRENVPEKYRGYAIKIGSDIDQKLHALRTRLSDEHGFGSEHATRNFLKTADAFDPDMVWLHNIHGYYINIEMLFEWIKKRPDMKVKWTLHDCWAFTGHCSYFTMAGCEQWRTHCLHCPQKNLYPASIIRDNCKNNFERKKAAFTGVKNLTLITPSRWLADLVKQSFLAEYPTEVCHNTIDTDIFKPTPSNFRKKYNLGDKRIVLGVASVWDERKGLNDFFKLAEILDEDSVIVLVGLTKKQVKALPQNVIGVTRTNSAKELAEIYSSADVFFNPTYEDNYPTVNLEAEACGTPVVTYNTGGSPEAVHRIDSKVIEVGNFRAVMDAIK